MICLACGRPEPQDVPEGPSEFRFPEQPNIVLVIVDALRRDHLGLYGYPKPTTPFLDTLTDEAVVFDDALAQSSVTFRSVATLLTSRSFPWLTRNADFGGVPGADKATQRRHAHVPYLHEANVTLPEVLANLGYETFAAFTNPHHHPTSGFWQGFDHAEFVSSATDKPYGSGVKVHDAFINWLDSRESQAPYFAVVYLMEVHNPYIPPRALRRLFVEKKGRMLYLNGKPDEEPTADDLAYMEALYDGEVRFMDGIVESLVANLRQRGEWQDTLLAFTSDHGDEFYEHGGLGHGKTLHLEQLRIPMLMAGAGLGEQDFADRRFRGVVRNLDLMPTLVEIAGGQVLPAFEGRSLLPAFKNRTLRSPMETESRAQVGGTQLSLTNEGWHFAIDMALDRRWLVDRGADPRGLRNLAEEHPDRVRVMSRALALWERQRQEADRFAAALERQDPGEEVDEAVLKQLEALGYLSN